ncbi:Transforming acidic coiled-coil-containing protein 2 [Orchesella cincta]|uniref:Transforming acidic coiled-coil-containing protein 2 n=1 Tax=Orchesella cincta TaxID=48709 RepID=A0A1D2NL37_ORCCI|nr:Transforming acidic coiled-coil-containing protein 2 [Orchesella cincta]
MDPQLDDYSYRSNLVGKFTQSVRRIVQDVRDEGAPSGQTKEEAMRTQLRLRATRRRLEINYETAKQALVNLHNQYEKSKEVRNVFTRYALLKSMIKEVVRLETQYWTLLDVPKQEKAEPVGCYVLRACSALEKVQLKQIEKAAAENEDRLREEKERLEDMTSTQIEAENTQLINDLYRLLKRYTGLRNLIRELTGEYTSSKYYPIIIRYTLLKDMIKEVTHNPDYMEVRHEHTISSIVAAS